MNRLLVGLGVALVLAPVLSLVLDRSRDAGPAPARPPAELVRADSAAPVPEPAPPPSPPFSGPGEERLFEEASRTAWTYVAEQYEPATGLVRSVAGYPYATMWDVASTLAAYHCAHALGIIDTADYDRRMEAALRTLRSLRLFDGAAFNKNYDVVRGLPAGRNDRTPPPGSDGYGWSATDIGRLLVWLKVVATTQPRHAEAAEAVVRRLDLARLVRDGYLRGAERRANGTVRTYQEGRIGYEQYAAAGFALWGVFADSALSLELNARPIEVLGVPLFTDRRGEARLTSEPFVLMGLEVGYWSPVWRQLATALLAAQEARSRRTGQLTMVSEDAIPVAPHFFYYYTLHADGEDFAVTAQTNRRPLASPRWVSAKAAFAWHALRPGPYTWEALRAVAPAADPATGWSSGIFEESGRPTGSPNINTAAVILEAALYHQRRRPLLVVE